LAFLGAANAACIIGSCGADLEYALLSAPDESAKMNEVLRVRGRRLADARAKGRFGSNRMRKVWVPALIAAGMVVAGCSAAGGAPDVRRMFGGSGRRLSLIMRLWL